MAQTEAQPAVAEIHNGGSETNGNGKGTTAVSFFSLKPQLVVEAPKAADAIQFYKTAFGAEELKREIHPKRKADQELPLILSAELKLGSSVLLVSDLTDDYPAPVKSDGSGYTLCLETSDIDGAMANALKAGAKIEGEIQEGENACCGARVGKVKDPYGYIWAFCSSDAGKKAGDVEA